MVAQTGNRISHIASGVFRTKSGQELPARLNQLHAALCAVLDEHKPDAVAVEAVFGAKHARSALVLGHARGVLLLAAAQRDLPIYEYPPATVKKAVSGDGRANKDQIGKMVQLLLGCPLDGPADRTDALAVAICHAQVGQFAGKLAELQREQQRAGRGSRRHPALRLKPKGE